MNEKTQFSIVWQILKRFEMAGILDRIILIGSWCLYFYRYGLPGLNNLPAPRTTDIDFLVPRPFCFKTKADVPAILTAMGFTPTFHGMSGLAVFDHPELRLEFLVPEIGRGDAGPVEIRDLNVNAQSIRYLNFLTAYPKKIRYHNITVSVPEPAAFALHKLIISARRTKKEKREKDLEAARGVLELLFSDPKAKNRVGAILAEVPSKWRKAILSVSAKHFPKLNQMWKRGA